MVLSFKRMTISDIGEDDDWYPVRNILIGMKVKEIYWCQRWDGQLHCELSLVKSISIPAYDNWETETIEAGERMTFADVKIRGWKNDKVE